MDTTSSYVKHTLAIVAQVTGDCGYGTRKFHLSNGWCRSGTDNHDCAQRYARQRYLLNFAGIEVVMPGPLEMMGLKGEGVTPINPLELTVAHNFTF